MTLLIFILLAIFFLYKIIQTKETNYGEEYIKKTLSVLNSSKYKVIHDLQLKSHGHSSQIDHVVISTSGIFVIETKNYQGWIFGSEESPYWTQSIYGYKKRFLNPIKQNHAHVIALKKALSDYPTLVYHPIVVFIPNDNMELKSIHAELPVLYSQELLPYIRKTGTGLPLSQEKIEEIEKILLKKHTPHLKEHIDYVRNRRWEIKEEKESVYVCPWCSSPLVEKKGRYGAFYGCKRYPHCHYTKDYR